MLPKRPHQPFAVQRRPAAASGWVQAGGGQAGPCQPFRWLREPPPSSLRATCRRSPRPASGIAAGNQKRIDAVRVTNATASIRSAIAKSNWSDTHSEFPPAGEITEIKHKALPRACPGTNGTATRQRQQPATNPASPPFERRATGSGTWPRSATETAPRPRAGLHSLPSRRNRRGKAEDRTAASRMAAPNPPRSAPLPIAAAGGRCPASSSPTKHVSRPPGSPRPAGRRTALRTTAIRMRRTSGGLRASPAAPLPVEARHRRR